MSENSRIMNSWYLGDGMPKIFNLHRLFRNNPIPGREPRKRLSSQIHHHFDHLLDLLMSKQLTSHPLRNKLQKQIQLRNDGGVRSRHRQRRRIRRKDSISNGESIARPTDWRRRKRRRGGTRRDDSIAGTTCSTKWRRDGWEDVGALEVGEDGGWDAVCGVPWAVQIEEEQTGIRGSHLLLLLLSLAVMMWWMMMGYEW